MTQATLELRAQHSTTLTPRLQQSVRLLQLSSNDFEQELRQALDTNPFLEEPSAKGSPTSTGDDALPASGSDVGVWAEAATTLRMHLHTGLASYRLDTRERTLAELVVEALDDDGYLRQALTDVVDHFDFDPPVDSDELSIALTLVQQLGPHGVGAATLAECLALQLVARRRHDERFGGRLDPCADLALVIVHEHLALVAASDWKTLRNRLGCASGALTAAVALIRTLDPRPCAAFQDDVSEIVVPDVIVHREHGRWSVDINPAVIPLIRLNETYAALFRDTRGGDRRLGEQLQDARWLVRNVAQRFVTVRRVARAIVAEQTTFLEYGDIGIRPLLLREVADRLGLHESTISRAIGNKSMATPRGVFAFRHFFSRRLETTSGGACSAAAIRAAMRELIDGEDRTEPMSDVFIAKRLGDDGIRVARRTVTKYRGLMRIPPVETRRAVR